jgi:hypothetical protein
MDENQLAQLYQQYLGRAPDPSGIATWSGQDPSAVIAGILGSPEYQGSHPSGDGGGASAPSAAPSVDNMQPVTDPSSGDTQYQYKDSSGGTVTVDSSGNPVGYTPGASWYQQQYAAHPDAIRSGMNNEQYLALGPLAQTQTINGKQVPITNAYEYQINPQTRALTTNPVDRQQSGGGFLDFMTSPTGALTAMALLGGAGLALPALVGEGALGAGMVDAAGNIIGAGAEGAATGAATGAAGGTSLADIAATQAAEDMAAGAAYPAGSVPAGAGLSGNVYGATGLDAVLAEAGLSGLTASDLLKYGMPLAGLASKLGGGSGAASSSLLGGGAKSGTAQTPFAQNQLAQNTGYDSTISNLTPGLTKGSQFRFANEPVFTETQTPMPMQAQPDYTQQILNAAQGGLVNHYAEGGDVPEAPSPFLKPELFRGRRLAPIGRFNSTQMPGYQPRQFADGGEVEGHNPQFFSEGGLNSLENTYVKGEGDGTSDSVPAMLANGEFVVPADVVSKLGNGSNDAGANVLDQFLATIREHAQKHDPKDLPPDSKGPLAYLLDAKRKA